MPRTTTKRATKKRTTKKRARKRRTATHRVNVQNIRTLTRELRPAVAKNKKRAERLIRDIEKRKARISADFYRIGLALKELHRPPIYQAAGHSP